MTLLAEVVAASDAVAATSKRTDKRDRLAELLVTLEPSEIVPAVGFLIGDVRQGRVGVGWATVGGLDEVAPAAATSLVVTDLDQLISDIEVTTGAGSQARRGELLTAFLARATEPEVDFVRRLLIGELRQGANDGVMADAVARAAGVPATVVRRAAMLSGDLRVTAAVALGEGRAALEAVGLHVGRGVLPMLASTAESTEVALEPFERATVEWKLDGIRVQVHRQGDGVRVFTRNLNDITERVPEVVEVARSLPVTSVVLDGEAIGLGPDGRPEMFQDTASRVGRDDATSHEMQLRPFFFDILHVDGRDLLDEPLSARQAELARVVGEHRIPTVTVGADVDHADFEADALARGHEGVMVKDLDSPYAAGRRGKAWRKVKPVRTLDLVVLAAEWGSGRRQGWLSNLHLGALGPDAGDGSGLVMVGKTFKGLTDELLTWQTEQFLARETHRTGHVVWVRPELVVEIALDGVQTSTRYPGGVALRFARVKGYRPDRDPDTADTIDAVRELRS